MLDFGFAQGKTLVFLIISSTVVSLVNKTHIYCNNFENAVKNLRLHKLVKI